MSTTCCPSTPAQQLHDNRYRRVLWTVLAINAAMFFIEAIAGLTAGSTSLQADALDFLADAANYGISYSSLAWRSTTVQEPPSQRA